MNKENSIEWYTGDTHATLSLTNKKYITRIKKLQARFPDAVDFVENPDLSICAHIPLSYLKINAPRQLSEEAKQAASERLRGLRNAD